MKSILSKIICLCCIFLFSIIEGQETPAESKMVLKVGYIPLMSQLPIIVSYENDRLNCSQIILRLYKYQSFTSLEAALRVNAIDIASIPVPIALSMAADGHDIRVIGMCHQGGSMLLTKLKGNLESIKGQLVGVPGLDSNENLRLGKILDGLDLRSGLDYKTIDVPFNTVINDLRTNKLNAIYLPEPYGTIAENEKNVFAVDDLQQQLNGGLNTVLVVRSEVLKKNKRGVVEWLKKLVKNCRYIEKDILVSGAEQTAIIQSSYFSFPKKVVVTSLTKRKGNLKFDQFFLDAGKIKEYLKLATQEKLINRSVDLDMLIDLDLMKEAIQQEVSLNEKIKSEI